MESSVCLICCDEIPQSTNNFLQIRSLNQFIQQTSQIISTGRLTLSEISYPLLSPQVTLCQNCVFLVCQATDQGKRIVEVEQEVRKLQRKILKMMTTLKTSMDSYLGDVKIMDQKIRTGNNGRLREMVTGRAATSVVQFRQNIVNVVGELSGYRDHLSNSPLVQVENPPTNPQPVCDLPTSAISIKMDVPIPDEIIIPDPIMSEEPIDIVVESPAPVTLPALESWPNNATGTELPPNRRLQLQSDPDYQSKNGKFKCSTCGKAFIAWSKLSRHKKTHLTQKPFKCGQCGKGFIRLDHLRVHSSVHTGERAFECETCKQRFTRHSSLITHRKKCPSQFILPS